MDSKIAESIALLKHQIISPVLLEPGRAQMAHFSIAAQREYDVPGRGPRRFTATTMKSWLQRYRKKGFQGLLPKTRKDLGGFRALAPEARAKIKCLRLEHLQESCTRFYDRCLHAACLGEPPVCIETLRRLLKAEGLYEKRQPRPRKRFEMRYFGELWTCDFMHGPLVTQKVAASAGRRRKAILMAIVDDHSRVIVGFEWGFSENTKLVENVFKDAILAHGVPDRLYCDNGAAFSSAYLALVCAKLDCGLVHSKPYDSPSRGKIERFFRTVRSSFLTDFSENAELTLETLNESFRTWLRDRYHHRHHHGIDGRPIDRLQASVRDYPRKRVSVEVLQEHFLVSVERSVNKDSTVSLNAVVYEVPPHYIDQKVVLKFSQEQPSEVFLYDQGRRVQKIVPVDAQMNGMVYKPGPRISDVALHAVIESTNGGKR